MIRTLVVSCAVLTALSVNVHLVGQCGQLPDAQNVVAGDEIWVISARDTNVPGCCVGPISCRQYICGQWCESNGLAMNTSGYHDAHETVIFIHGYNTELESACTRGLQVYRNLFGNCCVRPPVRYVIWAWRSERETIRPIRDFTIKSERAIALGNRFAQTLYTLGPKPPVILGYSLGAQIAVSALTQSNLYHGPPVQLAVIAAATGCGFASCEGQMRRCGAISRTTIFLNQGDRAVRAASVICKAKFGPRFKSFEQLAPPCSQYFGEVNVVDMTLVATKKHSIVRYTKLPVVQSCVLQMILQNSGVATVSTGVEDSSSNVPGVVPESATDYR